MNQVRIIKFPYWSANQKQDVMSDWLCNKVVLNKRKQYALTCAQQYRTNFELHNECESSDISHQKESGQRYLLRWPTSLKITLFSVLKKTVSKILFWVECFRWFHFWFMVWGWAEIQIRHRMTFSHLHWKRLTQFDCLIFRNRERIMRWRLKRVENRVNWGWWGEVWV